MERARRRSWVAPVPPDGFEASDGRRVGIRLRNIPVINQPGWPALDAPAAPATMNPHAIWTASTDRVEYTDPSRHMKFAGYRATAQLEADVSVPSLRFTWKSDPLASSRANFGVIGEESNGKYVDG